MNQLFFNFFFTLILSLQVTAAEINPIDNLMTDDQISSLTGKDIWYDDNTVDEHIKLNANSADSYIDFIYKMAEQVLSYDVAGISFLTQRSLIADGLAVAVSRNYVMGANSKVIDVQSLLDQADLARKSNFYPVILEALSYSSINTASFYRRFLIWSVHLDDTDCSRFFQTWLLSTRLSYDGLQTFLNNFNLQNKEFIKKFTLHPLLLQKGISYIQSFFGIARLNKKLIGPQMALTPSALMCQNLF